MNRNTIRKRSKKPQKLKLNPKRVAVKQKSNQLRRKSQTRKFMRISNSSSKNPDVEEGSTTTNPQSKQPCAKIVIMEEDEIKLQNSSIKNSTVESNTRITQKKTTLSKNNKITTQAEALKLNKGIDFDSVNPNDIAEIFNSGDDENDGEGHILQNRSSTMDYFNLNRLKLKTFVDKIGDEGEEKKNKKEDNKDSTVDLRKKLIDDEEKEKKFLIDLDSNFKKWWDILNAVLIVNFCFFFNFFKILFPK